jgi:serine phosphatase RsbU (regulator of sigma subunit)
MSKKMQDQQKEIKSANSILKATHAELETTHAELEATHFELEGHNERMVESIRYAEMIQRSLLPGIERIKAVSPDSMFIWIPKDIVGGDIFYTYADPEGSLIALMDCTGHGVPGAFLTMIVYSEIRKIIMDEACRLPSEILKRLNRAVKTVLHTNNDDTTADDGLDAAICIIDHSGKKVTYAGAKIPLFYVKNGVYHRRNGDKQSIGYKDSDDDFEFTNHIIDVDDQCTFYMKTDGFTDQLGGVKRLRFGTDKFKKLIMENYDKPYSDQRKTFLQTLLEYQGENEQMDDITLIGFQLICDS